MPRKTKPKNATATNAKLPNSNQLLKNKIKKKKPLKISNMKLNWCASGVSAARSFNFDVGAKNFSPKVQSENIKIMYKHFVGYDIMYIYETYTWGQNFPRSFLVYDRKFMERPAGYIIIWRRATLWTRADKRQTLIWVFVTSYHMEILFVNTFMFGTWPETGRHMWRPAIGWLGFRLLGNAGDGEGERSSRRSTCQCVKSCTPGSVQLCRQFYCGDEIK